MQYSNLPYLLWIKKNLGISLEVPAHAETVHIDMRRWGDQHHPKSQDKIIKEVNVIKLALWTYLIDQWIVNNYSVQYVGKAIHG